MGAATPTPTLSAAHGLSCRRFATAGNEALGKWGLLPPRPCFPLRLVCLAGGSLLSTAGNKTLGRRGRRPPTPLSAALGLSCRRLATAGNEAHGRWGLLPPHPRFPLRTAFLEMARYCG